MRWFRKSTDLERRLRDARAEQQEVRREGAEREPMLRRLEGHAATNHFAERFEQALRQRRKA